MTANGEKDETVPENSILSGNLTGNAPARNARLRRLDRIAAKQAKTIGLPCPNL